MTEKNAELSRGPIPSFLVAVGIGWWLLVGDPPLLLVLLLIPGRLYVVE